MTDLSESVAQIVTFNGGRVVGKTRLQKFFFLLESKGIGFGIDFDYHHFGPFSVELAQAADDATELGYISATPEMGFHQVPYYVFETKNYLAASETDETGHKRIGALETMKEYSALELEVAATAIYLRDNGFQDSFIDELKIRKPQKATPERIERARQLIRKLGL
jgi:uncharacterized protein YwgA